MKRLFACFLIFVIGCGVATAQDKGIGVGVVAGDPTGLSAKLWLGDSGAIDAAVAWSFTNTPALYLHADYLLHGVVPIDLPAGVIMFHFGVGGLLKLTFDPIVGIRAPAGVAYWFEEVPIEVFLEIGAVLALIPATQIGFNGGLGFRYYFSGE